MPVDFPEILSAIAPRPALVVAPTLDWHHPQDQVARTVKTARRAYTHAQAAGQLQLYTPNCLAEFKNDIQARIIAFLQTTPVPQTVLGKR